MPNVDIIHCPHAKSDMTPCVARDGDLAVANDGVCVGCGQSPAALFQKLVTKYVSSHEASWHEAEGRERGIKEAAAAVAEYPSHCPACDDCSLPDPEETILALLHHPKDEKA